MGGEWCQVLSFCLTFSCDKNEASPKAEAVVGGDFKMKSQIHSFR